MPHPDHSAAILAYLREYVDSNGYGPTLDEIAAACGLSGKRHAHYWLVRLRELGQVCQMQRYRGWRVV